AGNLNISDGIRVLHLNQIVSAAGNLAGERDAVDRHPVIAHEDLVKAEWQLPVEGEAPQAQTLWMRGRERRTYEARYDRQGSAPEVSVGGDGFVVDADCGNPLSDRVEINVQLVKSGSDQDHRPIELF